MCTLLSASGDIGRERKISFHLENVLPLVVAAFRHSQQWDFKARLFKIKSKKFEQETANFMEVVSGHLYGKCTQRVKKRTCHGAS